MMTEPKIGAGTIARTICLVLALANQVRSATGHSVLPIENEQVESLVTVGLTVVTSMVSWWKNNSISKEAIEADEVMKLKKANARK